MMLALLPLLFIALIFGFTAIERDTASIPPPAVPSKAITTNAAGQQFMLYRDAVMAYAQQSLGTQNNSQPVLPTALQGAVAAPRGAVAVIVGNMTASTLGTSSAYGPGYIVCVWMKAPAGTAAITANQDEQDRTIGTVEVGGTTWAPAVTAGSNAPTQTIPSGCLKPGYPVTQPQQGNIISISGVGGN